MGSKITKGAFLSYISIVINIAAGLLYTPWMVRQIGNSNYGIYNLAITFIGYFTLDFGLGGAITRYIAQYKAQKEEEKINDLIGLTTKLYFVLSAIIGAILLIVLCFIKQIFISLSPDELQTFRNVFMILSVYSVISVPMMPFSGIISAYEYFWQLKMFDIANRILTIALVIAALLGHMGIYALVMANVSAGLVIGIGKFIFIKRKCGIKVNWSFFDKAITKDLFSFSIWMTLGMTAYQLVIGMDSTILGITSGAEEIAIFSAGMTIYAYTNHFAGALNGLFLPKVTRMLYDDNSLDQINALMIRVGKIQLVIIGALYFGFLVVGREFMDVWMGGIYVRSYVISALIVLPNLLISTQAIASTMVTAVNKLKYQAMTACIGAVVSLTIGYSLSRQFGAVGVAVGSAVGMLLSYGLMMNILYARVFKLNIKRFFLKCHLKYIFCVIPPVLVCRLSYCVLPGHSWANIAIRIAVFMLVYLCCLLLYFDQSEKKVIFGRVMARIRH